MSVRDYFAAAALTGLVSSPKAMVGMREVGVGYGMGVEEYASRMAYEMADAMLVERDSVVEPSGLGPGGICKHGGPLNRVQSSHGQYPAHLGLAGASG